MSQAQKVHRMKTHYRQEGIVGKHACSRPGCVNTTNSKSKVCAPCSVAERHEQNETALDRENARARLGRLFERAAVRRAPEPAGGIRQCDTPRGCGFGEAPEYCRHPNGICEGAA